MKKILLVLSLLFYISLLHGQRQFFIYIQSENYKPFFLRMDEKVFSSSASGYLILAPLKDSVYPFQIGFPGTTNDVFFQVATKNSDHGFLLKDFGEKGWALFDLQTLSVIQGKSNKAEQAMPDQAVAVNAFTEMLSKAANDPSLKYTAVVLTKPEVKKETVDKPNETLAENKKEPLSETETVKETVKSKPLIEENTVIKMDTVAVAKATVTIDKVDADVKKPIQEEKNVSEKNYEFKKSVVTKSGSTMVNNGISITYLDDNGIGKTDTIQIFISDIIKSDTQKNIQQTPKKFLDISSDSNQNANKVAQEKPSLKTQASCKAIASENDFLKLRRKMASKTNDDGMMDEAAKYFKQKCFIVEQIKNLSSLFLSDAGKLNFYKTAYSSTSDKENFPSLKSQLSNSDYQLKFAAIYNN